MAKATKKKTKAVKKVVETKKLVNSTSSSRSFLIPSRLLKPIGVFLSNQLKMLEKRRASLDSDDPFMTGREDNLASPDTNAAEQFGHARVEALKHQLDRRIIQMRKALSRVKVGNYGICERCGNLIDTDRLMIYPEATLCVSCEKSKEKKK